MSDLWQAHLTFALLVFLLTPRIGTTPAAHTLRLAAALAISFIPVSDLPLAAYLRSFTDDLAITTLLALLFAGLVRMGVAAPLPSAQRCQLLLVFGLLALFLFPATLGLTYFDPYALGYNPRPLLVIIGLLALGLLLLHNWLAAAMLGLATLAFIAGIKPSGNYWDYLLDPFIAVYCWGALLGYSIRKGCAPRPAKLPLQP